MGGRGLPGEKIVWLRLAVASLATLLVGVACSSGGAEKPKPEATSTPFESVEGTQATPTATSTPDIFAQNPASETDAKALVEAALRETPRGCSLRLLEQQAACVTGDTDGDGAIDVVVLVPVPRAASQLPHPGVIFVQRAGSSRLEEFAADLSADSSVLGLGFFALDDRSGDGRGDISYLENVCTASGCRTESVVQSWDGTAWRDIGTGEPISNIDRVAWEGKGSESKLTVHGGKLPDSAPRESGPTRSATVTYALKNGRYAAIETIPDPPEYLYHAVEDADRAFAQQAGTAGPAYESVVALSGQLKDWSLADGQKDRRPALVGYALFRLALIETALGRDPTARLDAVVLQSASSGEPLFGKVAEAFRKGYQEQGGLQGACAEVNRFLNLKTPEGDNPAYVEQLFNYGYANKPGSAWLSAICPF